jgi:hypothetical protein
MVSVLVPILLIAVIVAALTFYLKSQGLILKKYPPSSVHYTVDFENGERPPYGSQHSHNSKFFIQFLNTRKVTKISVLEKLLFRY